MFEQVLRNQLSLIEGELKEDRFQLYSALLDMHRVTGLPEDLKAILTINYDEYIEDAVKTTYNRPIDFGIAVENHDRPSEALRLLKLHGSFGWEDTWPVSTDRQSSTLWIPPGIQKRKERYPFNVLWGLARESLDCDILRIVGCQLSGSDWDLISLLFTTRHANPDKPAYIVEVIDSPEHAFRLQSQYPYLEIKSMLEIEEYDLGRQIVGDLLYSGPRAYRSLSERDQARVLDGLHNRDENWFRLWLLYMAEALSSEPDIKTIETETGAFHALLSS